jgi:membrane peptidoglycan carboxypeptidase
MGYSDTPKPLRGIGGYGEVYGGTIPAITWARFMGPAHEGVPVVDFAEPGPLPPPSSGIRTQPPEYAIPTAPRDCGGTSCYDLPLVTSPTTAPPPVTTPEGAVIEGGAEPPPAPPTTMRPRTGAPTTTITAPEKRPET